MPRKKTEQNPTARLEAEVVRLLCAGHDIFTAAEQAHCDPGFAYVVSIQPETIALAEAARLEAEARGAA